MSKSPSATSTPASQLTEPAELERVGQPLTKAHELLRDMNYKVDGVTRGDFLKLWPEVYAQIYGIVIDEYRTISKKCLKPSEIVALDAYQYAIAGAVNKWPDARIENTKAITD